MFTLHINEWVIADIHGTKEMQSKKGSLAITAENRIAHHQLRKENGFIVQYYSICEAKNFFFECTTKDVTKQVNHQHIIQPPIWFKQLPIKKAFNTTAIDHISVCVLWKNKNWSKKKWKRNDSMDKYIINHRSIEEICLGESINEEEHKVQS